MARRFLSLSTSSADVASFTPLETGDFPSGPVNSVLVTDSAGDTVEWTDKLDIETLNVNGDVGIGGELIVSGNAGSDGQVLRKTLTGPEWQTLPAFDLSDVPVGAEGQVLTTVANEATWQDPTMPIVPGQSGQILITDAAGTATEWSSDISPDNVTVATDLTLLGTLNLDTGTGTTGQFIKKTASGQEWTEATVSDLDVGAEGQVLRTVSGAATWTNLHPLTVSPGEISPGTVRDVLVTGADGNVGWTNTITPTHLNVIGTLSLDSSTGSVGQVMQQTATGVPEWADLEVDVSHLGAGTTGQVLTTTASNQAEWQNLPAFALSNIPPGSTPRQLLETNAAGTAAQWTSNVVVPGTLSVAGNASLNGTFVAVNADLRLDNVSGSAGQFVRKTGGATQAWSNVVASDVQPGLAHATLQTNAAGTANEMTVEPNFPLLYIGGTRLYYTSYSASIPVYWSRAFPAGGSYSTGTSITPFFARTGNIVSVSIPSFSVDFTSTFDCHLKVEVPATYRSSGTRWGRSTCLIRLYGDTTDKLVAVRQPQGNLSIGIYAGIEEEEELFPSGTVELTVRNFTMSYPLVP